MFQMSRLPRGAHCGFILAHVRLQQLICNRAKPSGSTWQSTNTADHWICLVEATCSVYLLSLRMPTLNIEGSFCLQLSILIALQSLLQAHHFDTRGTISAQLYTLPTRLSSPLCYPRLASTQEGEENLSLRMAVIVLSKNGEIGSLTSVNRKAQRHSVQETVPSFRLAKTESRVPLSSTLSALLLKPQIAHSRQQRKLEYGRSLPSASILGQSPKRSLTSIA